MAGPKSAAEPILIDLNNPSDEAIAQLRERGAPRSSQKAAGTSTKSGTSKRERKGTLIEEIPDGQSIDDVFEAQDGEHHEEEEDEDDFQLTPFQEEVIEAVLWVVLGCFFFAGFDIAAHAQYAQHTTILKELGRVGNFAPGLAFVVFYTNRYCHTPLGQLQLFAMSAIGGSYMVYTVNFASYTKILHQMPALGVLWVWAVWMLPLGKAVLSLLIVAAFSWYNGLDFFTISV